MTNAKLLLLIDDHQSQIFEFNIFAQEAVRARMIELLTKIPYGEVVEVEQELISEGLPESEVLRLCDIHSQALEGHIDLSGMKIVAPGHPEDTFK